MGKPKILAFQALEIFSEILTASLKTFSALKDMIRPRLNSFVGSVSADEVLLACNTVEAVRVGALFALTFAMFRAEQNRQLRSGRL